MCMNIRQGKWHAVSGKCMACVAYKLDIRKVEVHGVFDSGCARFSSGFCLGRGYMRH